MKGLHLKQDMDKKPRLMESSREEKIIKPLEMMNNKPLEEPFKNLLQTKKM